MRIVAEPLTAEAFKPFGAVVEGPHAPGRGSAPSPRAPASFAVLMWRDGASGDEEFVPVTTPLTVVVP